MPGTKRNVLFSYSAALLFTALALALRWLLNPWLGDQLPFITLPAAVAAAVWFGGAGPGVVASLASYLGGVTLLPESGLAGSFASAGGLPGLAAWLVSCSIIIGLGEVAERARRRAAEGRDLLRVTFESAGDGMITTDQRGVILSMNPVAETLTGWPLSEAAGRPLPDVFHIVNEGSRQPVDNPALRALREGIIFGLANHTLLIPRGGGEEIPIDDSGAPIRTGDGVAGAVLIFRDITQRRRLEKENAERLASTRLLASIVESSTDVIISKSLDGTIRTWNAAAERLFGWSEAEAVGRPITLIIPPDRLKEEETIIARLRTGERMDHFETIRVTRDGRTVPVSLTVSPILDEAGVVVGVSKIARDMTEWKKAQEALVASEQRFRLMADAAPVLIWTSGADKLCNWFNQQWLDFVGRPMEKELGNGWAENVHPDDFERCLAIYTTSFDARRAFKMEYRLRRHDGHYRWVIDHGAPLLGSGGDFTGFIGSCIDITERKEAEQQLDSFLRERQQAAEALRRSMEQLQIVTETMSAPVTRCSRDLRYVWVSRPYAEWIGRPPDEVVGRPIVDVLGAEAVHQLRPHFDRVLTGEPVTYEEEVPFAGIGRRWVKGIYTPTFGPDGVPDGWVAVVLDIHDAKQAEQALRAADRRKDDFLATLAHELRNPLTPILNSVEQMKRTMPSAGGDGRGPAVAVAPPLATMERQVRTMVRLIDDLMDISRITRDKLALRLEPVELATVVGHAMEASRPLAATFQHTLEVSLPQAPIFLLADEVRLAQVLGNLLTNACKYTPPGGRISLTAQLEDGHVAVAVSDSGIGIPREMLPHIFDLFTQVDASLERSVGGLGIGLSLVKRLVEMHGGSVMAQSEGTGQGSRFTVRLPVHLGTMPGATPPADAAGAAGGRRILVVDDNVDSAVSLASLLEMTGHETRIAHDGEKALAGVASFEPDIVLLDIGLPRMNGYDVCRAIRRNDGQQPLMIALTGWGQDEDRRRSSEAGFDAHLVKPVDFEALTRLLESLTSRTA